MVSKAMKKPLPEHEIARLAVDLIAKRLQKMGVYTRVVVTIGKETVEREIFEGDTLNFTVPNYDPFDLAFFI